MRYYYDPEFTKVAVAIPMPLPGPRIPVELMRGFKMARSPLLVGGLGVTGGTLGAAYVTKKLLNDIVKEDSEEGKKLYDSIAETAKKDGVKVKTYTKPRSGLNSYYDTQNDLIRTTRRGDLVAHEYGHSRYSRPGRDGWFGRAVHKLYGPSYLFGTLNPIGTGLSLANGVASGIISGLGNGNQSFFRKYQAGLVPAIASLPLLAAEGMASWRGLRELEKQGASEEYMKQARRNLRNAYGTYLGSTAINASLGLTARGLSQALTRGLLKH